jgi:hypothetical protein
MTACTLLTRALVLAALLTAGCASTARPVVVSIRHPANPAAAEAPLPPDSTTLAVPTPEGR